MVKGRFIGEKYLTCLILDAMHSFKSSRLEVWTGVNCNYSQMANFFIHILEGVKFSPSHRTILKSKIQYIQAFTPCRLLEEMIPDHKNYAYVTQCPREKRTLKAISYPGFTVLKQLYTEIRSGVPQFLYFTSDIWAWLWTRTT